MSGAEAPVVAAWSLTSSAVKECLASEDKTQLERSLKFM